MVNIPRGLKTVESDFSSRKFLENILKEARSRLTRSNAYFQNSKIKKQTNFANYSPVSTRNEVHPKWIKKKDVFRNKIRGGCISDIRKGMLNVAIRIEGTMSRAISCAF